MPCGCSAAEPQDAVLLLRNTKTNAHGKLIAKLQAMPYQGVLMYL
jgi:hypothetical protein